MGKRGFLGFFKGKKRSESSDSDRPRQDRATCSTCNGSRSITQLTGYKDANGNPLTQRVRCPDC